MYVKFETFPNTQMNLCTVIGEEYAMKDLKRPSMQQRKSQAEVEGLVVGRSAFQ